MSSAKGSGFTLWLSSLVVVERIGVQLTLLLLAVAERA